MFSSRRRFVLALSALLLSAGFVVGSQEDADAGLATSVGLVANLTYSGSASDLVISFRLLNRVTGRVLWQADPADINAIKTTSTNVRVSTTMASGDWWWSNDYEWSCRVDARDATSSVYWVDFKQWVDAVIYSAPTLPSGNIQGTTSEGLLLGQVNNDYL